MRHALATVICVLGLAAAAAAQQQEPTAARIRTRVPSPVPAATGAVTVDGAVTESMWESALKLELRYEVRPGENVAPPVRTEMLLAHDDRTLFVAFR